MLSFILPLFLQLIFTVALILVPILFYHSTFSNLDLESPKISTNETIVRGQPLQIRCKADSNQNISYTWLKDDQLVDHASILNFNSIEKENEGMYTCIAKTRVEEKRNTIYIFLHCKNATVYSYRCFFFILYVQNFTQRKGYRVICSLQKIIHFYNYGNKCLSKVLKMQNFMNLWRL